MNSAIAAEYVVCRAPRPSISITASGARFIGGTMNHVQKIGISPWYALRWELHENFVTIRKPDLTQEGRKRHGDGSGVNNDPGLKSALLHLGYRAGHVIPLALVKAERNVEVVFRLGSGQERSHLVKAEAAA